MRDCAQVTTVSLLKYEGVGNDFLIALDPAGLPSVPAVGPSVPAGGLSVPAGGPSVPAGGPVAPVTPVAPVARVAPTAPGTPTARVAPTAPGTPTARVTPTAAGSPTTGSESSRGRGHRGAPPAVPLAGDELDSAFVINVCERRRGVGADGLIVARPTAGPAHFRMELRNADGSRAETSGNGLRCVALAAIDAGLVDGDEVVVETDAGLRRVTIEQPANGARRESDRLGWPAIVRAEMGVVRLGEEVAPPEPLSAEWSARYVDVGNPHLVLLGPSLEGIDIADIGRRLELARPGGQNVEVAAPTSDGLALRVWERGAGLTEACGTGSCAVAAVARAVGLAGDRVVVQNPGGTVIVDLAGSDPFAPAAGLSGPARRVARVEVDVCEPGVGGR